MTIKAENDQITREFPELNSDSNDFVQSQQLRSVTRRRNIVVILLFAWIILLIVKFFR